MFKRVAWVFVGLVIAITASSTELTRERNTATRLVFSFFSSTDGSVITAPGTVTCYCEDYDDDAAWDGTETACTTADTVTGNRVEQQLTAGETNTDFVQVRCTSNATNSMDREFHITTKGLFATTEANADVDVSATGEVGIDWANVGTPTATVDLANTTTGTVDTATALGAGAVNDTSVGTLANSNFATLDSNPVSFGTDSADTLTIGSLVLNNSGGTTPGLDITGNASAPAFRISANAAQPAARWFGGTYGLFASGTTAGVSAAGITAGIGLQVSGAGAGNDLDAGGTELRDSVTGGAYALDTDANGRMRIVDGVGVGEIDTLAGSIVNVDLVDTTTTNTDMRGTDNAALASVLGALADAASTGDVDTATTTISYLKQLINTLEGAPGMPAFPVGAAPANNVSLAETIRYLYDQVGTAGASLTDLGGMSTAMQAEVQTEANDALVANHLDHLLAVDYDPATPPGVVTALLNELVENDAGEARYTVNALENAPSGTGASAATIADAVWDELKADHTGATTFGDIAADLVTAQTDLDTITGTDGATLATAQANYAPSTHTAANVWGVTSGSAAEDSYGNIIDDLTAEPVATYEFTTAALANAPAGGTGLTALASGTARAGAENNEIDLATAETFLDSQLVGTVVKITGGTGAGQNRCITANVAASDMATVESNWTTNPDATSTYEIVSGVAGTCPDTTAVASAAIADDVWDEAVSGHDTEDSFGNMLNDAWVEGSDGVYQLDRLDEDETTIDINATATGAAASVTGSVGSVVGHTPQTADHTAGIADIPTVAEFNARTLVSAGYFDPALDTVANVTTTATATALGPDAVNNTSTNLTETLNSNPVTGSIVEADFAAGAITQNVVEPDYAAATALATAQADLNTITGTDGATLATAQANYAPNTVVPDAAGTAAGLHTTTDAAIAALNDLSSAEAATAVAGIIIEGAVPLDDVLAILYARQVGVVTRSGTAPNYSYVIEEPTGTTTRATFDVNSSTGLRDNVTVSPP